MWIRVRLKSLPDPGGPKTQSPLRDPGPLHPTPPKWRFHSLGVSIYLFGHGLAAPAPGHGQVAFGTNRTALANFRFELQVRAPMNLCARPYHWPYWTAFFGFSHLLGIMIAHIVTNIDLQLSNALVTIPCICLQIHICRCLCQTIHVINCNQRARVTGITSPEVRKCN